MAALQAILVVLPAPGAAKPDQVSPYLETSAVGGRLAASAEGVAGLETAKAKAVKVAEVSTAILVRVGGRGRFHYSLYIPAGVQSHFFFSSVSSQEEGRCQATQATAWA
jgi:hypothetical protein